MALYRDLINISRQDSLQDRVKYALETAAINVMAESNTVTSHATRVTYAIKVLSGQENLFECAVAVMTNPTIAAEANIATIPDFGIPDTDMQSAVNSLFNALAGVAN